jgi:hypothetical protein
MGETPVSEVPTPCHTPVTGEGDANPNLVTWYGPDDPENPMNWYVVSVLQTRHDTSRSVAFCALRYTV